MIQTVVTLPSNQKRTLAETTENFDHTWLARRSAPDPSTVILRSDKPEPALECGTDVQLESYHGVSFWKWRVLARWEGKDQVAGRPCNMDEKYQFHTVEDR